jgi:murein DD-endopeptidase MepM/ murein hydrolase activator NlpD
VNRRKTNAWILLALGLLALVAGLWLWRPERLFSLRPGGLQSADDPLEMPSRGEPDFRFHALSAWQAAMVPRAMRFDLPLGSEHGALVYNAQKFWEINQKRGGHHTGDDLNGIGGMNTDLGDPVFSVADGLVLYAAEPSPGWGRLILVAHRASDGRSLHSMYAHLDRIDVKPGDIVARGSRIGTVGTANGYYPAHLHFEMRESHGVDIGGGYSLYPLNRLDPEKTIASLRVVAAEKLTPSPLAVMEAAGKRGVR